MAELNWQYCINNDNFVILHGLFKGSKSPHTEANTDLDKGNKTGLCNFFISGKLSYTNQ